MQDAQRCASEGKHGVCLWPSVTVNSEYNVEIAGRLGTYEGRA